MPARAVNTPALPQPAPPLGVEAEQCLICADESHYFGIGACDHPVRGGGEGAGVALLYRLPSL